MRAVIYACTCNRKRPPRRSYVDHIWRNDGSLAGQVCRCYKCHGYVAFPNVPRRPDTPRVLIEVRAAEIAIEWQEEISTSLTCSLSTVAYSGEQCGWIDHVFDDVPSDSDALAGWLAREIYIHEGT